MLGSVAHHARVLASTTRWACAPPNRSALDALMPRLTRGGSKNSLQLGSHERSRRGTHGTFTYALPPCGIRRKVKVEGEVVLEVSLHRGEEEEERRRREEGRREEGRGGEKSKMEKKFKNSKFKNVQKLRKFSLLPPSFFPPFLPSSPPPPSPSPLHSICARCSPPRGTEPTPTFPTPPPFLRTMNSTSLCLHS